MALHSGLKCFSNQLCVLWCFLVLISVNAKNLDQNHQSCEHVENFFNSINVTMNPVYDNTGETCGGHCCDDRTENSLQSEATKNFERLVKLHTRSHRAIWETTANVFRDHVLELIRQSEGRALNLFSQVYRKMAPLSRVPIEDLYKSIKNHLTLKYQVEDDLEHVGETFFRTLFPVAYHHAVHSEPDHQSGSNYHGKDFHDDYKNCLLHVYDQLQPFGDIPRTLSRSLVQSVRAATIFVRALDNGAEILADVESLDTKDVSLKCKQALLKINFCASCKGHNQNHAKSCKGFCTNVMRGCLSQYFGNLDKDWYSFSEAITKLLNLVRSNDGIEHVIKGIDAKLSEAIMHAMENGPALEMKVKRACGTPTLLPHDEDMSTIPKPNLIMGPKWPSPPDTQMLHFLVTLDKTKGFFFKIADSLCAEEDYQHSDKNCWTGDHLGDYTQTIISANTQKYNPEVEYMSIETSRENKLRYLADRVINLKEIVLKPLSHSAKHDPDKMQSDMAEGSGHGPYYEQGFSEDEDYADNGSGSGDGSRKIPQIINVHSSDMATPAGKGASNRISSSSSLVYLAILTITGIYYRIH